MAAIKPIRTEGDLDRALARIDEIFDAEADTPESDELDVLVDLVEHYESRHYPIGYPTPIDAVRFQMDQAGLTRRDLIPFMGSRAKVSEVLSGKRAITMSMARALHEHLGIPAEVLLQKPAGSVGASLGDLEPQRFPLKAMARRGWVPDVSDLQARAEELIAGLIDRAGGRGAATATALYRKNDVRRVNANTDPYALMAWCWQVLATANDNLLDAEYDTGAVTPEFLRRVAQLSKSEQGPRLAQECLAEEGIAMVVVPHLPRTHLDGAALRLADGRPVIGLTLRYDRIDNFWFCLLHELVHVGRHLDEHHPNFIDDMRLRSDDSKESEADESAQEALIPGSAWNASAVRQAPTAMNVIDLANETGVHPAIVAGRVRYERNNYRLLSQFVGSGQVRRQFETGRGPDDRKV